mmetsp:Transcript_30926/g.45237  ORF Transcript_30926/g.45237 Transcript_30926/m.45237 type:complete len:644 (+) Transcript_30926:221-2152(+)
MSFLLLCTIFLSSTITNAFFLPHTKPSITSLSSTIFPDTYQTFGDGALSTSTFLDLYSTTTNTNSSSPTLPTWLTTRCTECGWTNPTLVQQKSISSILQGKDVVIQAQTGSGKTLSYLLPLLSKIDASRAATQALVVVPTRELGLQVSRVARRLASAYTTSSDTTTQEEEGLEEGEESEEEIIMDNKGKRILIMSVLQGSTNRRQRAWAWAEPPHIVIGTPTELTNMVSRGALRYNSVKLVVVDEVDACLLHSTGAGAGNGAARMNLANAGPLHELLSRYLSPTYDEVSDEDDYEAGTFASRIVTTKASSAAATISTTTSSFDTPKLSKTISHGKDRQTVFASATIPQRSHFIKSCISNKWMTTSSEKEVDVVRVSPGELVPPTLQHSYMVVRTKEMKLLGLKRYIDREVSNKKKGGVALKRVLIFCHTKRNMEQMAYILSKDLAGGSAGEENEVKELEHGIFFAQMESNKRKVVVSVLRYEDNLSGRAAAMDAFRGGVSNTYGRAKEYKNTQINNDEGEDDDEDTSIHNSSSKEGEEEDDTIRILFSTDLAARGLDVTDVFHVINFDLPTNDSGAGAAVDAYVHRGGRAGRMGKRGKVVSLITAEEEFVLERLKNELGLDDFRCVARQQSAERKKGRKRRVD